MVGVFLFFSCAVSGPLPIFPQPRPGCQDPDARPRSLSHGERLVTTAEAALGNKLSTEQAESKWFDRNVGTYQAFIDVGANHGVYSAKANAAMRGGHIIAVEANPDLGERIKATVEAEGGAENANRFTLAQCAASDGRGTIQFNIAASDTLSSIAPTAGASRAVTVEARTLADLYKAHLGAQGDLRTLIKIDVEGAEYRVVNGAGALLGSPHVDFFVELHAWGDTDIRKFPTHVLSLFKARGYRFERIGSLMLFSLSHPDATSTDYGRWTRLYALKQLPYSHLTFLQPMVRLLKKSGVQLRG